MAASSVSDLSTKTLQVRMDDDERAAWDDFGAPRPCAVGRPAKPGELVPVEPPMLDVEGSDSEHDVEQDMPVSSVTALSTRSRPALSFRRCLLVAITIVLSLLNVVLPFIVFDGKPFVS